ncbi:MAG: hypothetical protein J1F01_05590 [Oscillospiraceae bacterium]|nr:hypothetical protein [Oscillospiraceae bacterium]
MLFEVTRTSRNYDYEIPHPKCKKITRVYTQVRNFTSPEEYDNWCRENRWLIRKNEFPWLEFGTNHRYNENGCIMRDNGTSDTWGIEINSLEELLDFQRSVGESIILQISDIDKKTPCLEIYDDYRE